MNLLLINHYAGSPYHGMEFRPFYLAREWVRMGHNVQIVAASYSHIRAKQHQFSGRVLDENIEGIGYRWYATPSYRGNGVGRVKNILSFIWTLWRDARQLVKAVKPDVVIASSTYPMDIWPAYRIAKLAKAKLVFEVHDLWPLSPIELGGMSKWHPFILWVKLAEEYAYRHADKVVSILPKTLDYMRSRGMSAHKFIHVPNGIDEEGWAQTLPLPSEVQSKIDKLRSLDLPLVGYAGTYGLANALDVLMDAANQLKGKAQIILVGTGPERDRLMARVALEGLTNVTMLTSVPKKAVPLFLAAVDIAYIGWHPNQLYRFGISPNKLVDYMMAGKPVIHSVCAGNDPVAEAGCGITVAPGDATAVAQAVIQIIALSASERAKMGLAGREYILKNHTYQTLSRLFLAAIAQ